MRNKLSLLARMVELLIAVVFLCAGLGKIAIFVQFADELRALLHLSRDLSTLGALTICAGEIYLACGLLFAERAARAYYTGCASLLLASFLGVLIIVNGNTSCSCFGSAVAFRWGSWLEEYPKIRDGILLAMCAASLGIRWKERDQPVLRASDSFLHMSDNS
jgi:hypothetical protein